MIGYRSTHILMIDNPNESEMFQRTFVVVWSSNKKQTDLTSQLVLSENVRVFWNNKKNDNYMTILRDNRPELDE